MPIRQEDIAQQLNLSVATVSLALRDSSQIPKETRQLVKKVAAQLGYTRRSRSVETIQSELSQISFIMRFPPTNAFYAGIIHGAERECHQHEISLHYTFLEEVSSQLLAQCKEVDGLLLVGTIDEASVLQLAELGRPCVLVDNNLPHLGLDQVLTANAASLERTVRSLYNLGHTRIAFLRGDDAGPSMRERTQGYRDTMANLGLKTVEIPCVGKGNQLLGVGEMVMTDFLAGHTPLPFTALIGCNDDAAIGALHALQNHGIHVPDEVSIVGFDGVEMSQAVWPQLTTNQVHRELMGAKAVQLLLERCKDPEMPQQSLTLSTTFIERASVAPRAQNAQPVARQTV